jgi:hypothetical protein
VAHFDVGANKPIVGNPVVARRKPVEPSPALTGLGKDDVGLIAAVANPFVKRRHIASPGFPRIAGRMLESDTM